MLEEWVFRRFSSTTKLQLCFPLFLSRLETICNYFVVALVSIFSSRVYQFIFRSLRFPCWLFLDTSLPNSLCTYSRLYKSTVLVLTFNCRLLQQFRLEQNQIQTEHSHCFIRLARTVKINTWKSEISLTNILATFQNLRLSSRVR